MEYCKVLKRENGIQIKVTIFLRKVGSSYAYDELTYDSMIEVRTRGKRKWLNPEVWHRSLSYEDREVTLISSLVTCTEILKVKLEMWEMIKPKLE